MAWLHHTNGFVLGVVGNVWGTVKEPVNAVSAITPHHGETICLGMLLDHVADVAILDAGFDALYRFLETFPRVADL